MRRFFVLLQLICTGFFLAGCSQQAPERPDIIWIMLDTLRADRLSCYGYPRPTSPQIDALAANGIRFARHYSQGNKTLYALPQMFYGQYFSPPIGVWVDTIPQVQKQSDQTLLPEVLSQGGYLTQGFSTHICYPEKSTLARSFDSWRLLPPSPASSQKPKLRHRQKLARKLKKQPSWDQPRVAYQWGDALVDQAIHWLSQPRKQPFFLYLHFMDTHFPHVLKKGYEDWLQVPLSEADLHKIRQPIHLDIGQAHDLPDRPLEVFQDLYDMDVRFVDDQIGRLLALLKEQGRLKKTLIVISSDHGEELGEYNGSFGHGRSLQDDQVHVPLIVHYPQGIPKPGVVESLTQNLDLPPTLLEVSQVSLSKPFRHEGRSLWPLLENPLGKALNEVVFSRGRASVPLPLMGLRSLEFRYVVRQGEEYLYRVNNPDPKTVNQDFPTELAFFRQEMEVFKQRFGRQQNTRFSLDNQTTMSNKQ